MTEPTETTLPIAELQPHPRNYNRHPEAQVKRIAASLRQFGQVRPIVVHRDTIIAGHGVYQAAQHLGYQSLRCTVLPENWTDEQAMAYLVTDNETRRGAEPDVTELAALLDELQQDFDLDSLGFDEQEYGALLDGLTPVDALDWDDVSLPDGDKSLFEQMTFTLTAEQAATVRNALEHAKDAGIFVDTGNENSNGNALARIAEAYCG